MSLTANAAMIAAADAADRIYAKLVRTRAQCQRAGAARTRGGLSPAQRPRESTLGCLERRAVSGTSGPHLGLANQPEACYK